MTVTQIGLCWNSNSDLKCEAKVCDKWPNNNITAVDRPYRWKLTYISQQYIKTRITLIGLLGYHYPQTANGAIVGKQQSVFNSKLYSMQANSLTPSVLLFIVCRGGGGYKLLNHKQIKEYGVTRTAAVWQMKELAANTKRHHNKTNYECFLVTAHFYVKQMANMFSHENTLSLFLFWCFYIWQTDDPHLYFITKRSSSSTFLNFPLFIICSKHIYFRMWITDCPVKMFWT